MEKTDLPKFLEYIRSIGTLWAPVKKNSHFIFDRIQHISEIDLSYHRTMVPIKKLFFPPKQVIMEYNLSGSISPTQIHDTYKQEFKTIFGVHPCEISGLNIQDDFFINGNYEDPYYKNLRNKTIIIGHSCIPDQNCICNNTATSEVISGFDLFFNELDDKYLIWVGSSLGDDIILDNRDLFIDELNQEDINEFNNWNIARNKQFHHTFDMTLMPKLMELSNEAEFWDDLGDLCLSCGTCTQVCPTCSCFNMSDKLKIAEYNKIIREREWDSCQFSEFSLVAGGNDFRPDQASRLKLYYTHKLNSYKGQLNYPSCVGCGRCIEFCPVDINIITVIERLQEVSK